MKIRDSGMPNEHTWTEFFDVDLILSELQVNSHIEDLAEFGCGYGTFTIPAARLISGTLHAFDIEKPMIDILTIKLNENGLENVIPEQRDIMEDKTELPNNAVDYVMLFNILHLENPRDLLLETHRILKPDGKAGIIHWRSDIPTPRGPKLTIRPTSQAIKDLIKKHDFGIRKSPIVLLPYHFGLVITKQ